jgi:hypothetical protein
MQQGQPAPNRNPEDLMYRKIPALTGLLGAAAVAASIGLATPGVANATEVGVSVSEQCAVQYPDKGAFFAADAYLLSARKASSWRCQQAAKWPGGMVSNLSVDIQDYCNRHSAGKAVALDPGNAYSWRCRK